MSGSASLNAPLATIDFSAVNTVKPPKKKRMSPLSVRLSTEQRERLERDAVGMSLNAYVLSKLFDDQPKPKRKHRKPTKRDKAIASALRRLAHSGMAAFLASQIVAQEEGRLGLSSDEEAELREAYTECYRIRCDLIEALGLQAEQDVDPASTLVTTGK